MLQQRTDANITRQWQTSLPRVPWSAQSLLAWDVVDILQREPFTHRRKIVLRSECSLWPALFNEDQNILILCGSNLGDLIRPSPMSSPRLCTKCQLVPTQRECLVAMVKSLKDSHLLRKKLKWACVKSRNPFISCTDSHRSGHFERIQSLVKREHCDPNMDNMLQHFYAGAIVFANPKHFQDDKCGAILTEKTISKAPRVEQAGSSTRLELEAARSVKRTTDQHCSPASGEGHGFHTAALESGANQCRVMQRMHIQDVTCIGGMHNMMLHLHCCKGPAKHVIGQAERRAHRGHVDRGRHLRHPHLTARTYAVLHGDDQIVRYADGGRG